MGYNFYNAKDELNSVTRKLDMQNINNFNDLIAAAALALRSGDSLALTELMDVVETGRRPQRSDALKLNC